MSTLKEQVEIFAERINGRVESQGVNFHVVTDKHKNSHEFMRFPGGPIKYRVNNTPKDVPEDFGKPAEKK